MKMKLSIFQLVVMDDDTIGEPHVTILDEKSNDKR